MELHLNPLRTKVVGTLEFKVETPVHVGVGGTEARRTFLRTPDGELVIPSSTWKGAFRSIAEKLSRTVEPSLNLERVAVESYREGERGIEYRSEQAVEELVKVLRGGRSDIIPESAERLREILEEIGYERQDLNEVEKKGLEAEERLAYRLAEDYLALYCPVGKLFGNKVLAGKVRFFDTILRVRTEERAGVGIDRSTGTVMERYLYFIEVIPRGHELNLTMLADNILPGETDSKLFASTLEFIRELGLQIGARKSAGCGLLKLSRGSFRVIDLEEDRERYGLWIGNPMRHALPMNLEEFLTWLRGQTGSPT